ncbi:FtsK/SpoIIIE domain-containing protein [Streptomyces sp. NBC_01016]|uniref:FtsK/SpoIIIE domain-containing protein n=1 Tax=Streptomyces sp. NBC_01016 TaxID=2903720 RepID=UPI002253BA2D|nr:FtsK/SpoIIIE domain-containing protein [Streptomyces sp. NBC_01016]MCX4828260.1 FtsK/SpoIIIE domain-containing protein [Streptomyces sp. NBC_01016]
MGWLTISVLAVVVGLALLLRWRRPAWFWMTFGVVYSVLKVRFRYASVMDACDLTVPASRFRLWLARLLNQEIPRQRVPRLMWIKPTRTGLRLRIRMQPGQDAFDYSSAVDRLRHAFGVHQVTSREIKPGVVEIAMTGYDVLRRVQMPAKIERKGLKVPVALVEDGSVYFRDYWSVPHSITIGASGSGKSVYQRRVIKELAALRVALVGIDCKQGVELSPLARRFSALADNPDDAAELLEALVDRMDEIYQVIRRVQRVSADTPDAEIAANIWDLPENERPVPIVLTIDEIAELALTTSRADEKRRTRIIVALVRLAQLGRAAGIFLDIYGQRFGSELGDGITMLRAQLTGRTAHRVNDESSSKMAFGDVSPHAVFAATQIRNDRPGMAVVGYSNGEWARIRTPHTTMREAVTACNKHDDLTPDIPELTRFRPVFDTDLPKAPVTLEPVAEPA